jgi:hypothetical protein
MTEAERTLDGIITKVQQEGDLPLYILRGGARSAERDMALAQMFTPEIMKAFRDAEADKVYSRCGGQYQPGQDCGISYNPVTCLSFERNDYLYRTESSAPYKDGELNTRVAMAMPEGGLIVATYQMVKVGTQWKLDGVDCGVDGDDFNL